MLITSIIALENLVQRIGYVPVAILIGSAIGSKTVLASSPAFTFLLLRFAHQVRSVASPTPS